MMSNTTTHYLESLYTEELYVMPSRLLVIINAEWAALTETDQTLLIKILGSVKQSLAAIQIINQPEFSMADLAVYNPARIISFGAVPQTALKFYEHLQWNGANLIVADALNVLDDAKKKSLWLALKQMFGI